MEAVDLLLISSQYVEQHSHFYVQKELSEYNSGQIFFPDQNKKSTWQQN